MIRKKKVGRGGIRTLVDVHFRFFSWTRGAVHEVDTSRDAQFCFTSNETVPVRIWKVELALIKNNWKRFCGCHVAQTQCAGSQTWYIVVLSNIYAMPKRSSETTTYKMRYFNNHLAGNSKPQFWLSMRATTHRCKMHRSQSCQCIDLYSKSLPAKGRVSIG